MAKRRSGISLYGKAILLFTIALAVCTVGILIYVYQSLMMYENYDINNYMTNLTEDLQKDISNGKISKYVELADVTSDYETKSSLSDGYKEFIKGKTLTYKKTSEENVYDIYADEDLLLTVTLNGNKTATKLALLTFKLWEVKDVKTYSEKGLYAIDLYTLEGNTVKINDVAVKDSDIVESTKIEGFEEAYDYVTLPKLNHIKVENLTKKPEIKVYDQDNKEVTITEENNIIYALNTEEISSSEEALKKLNGFDPLLIAENYSLFLTRDYSFSSLAKNLITNTEFYKSSQIYSRQDIAFISAHRLNNPTFTDEEEKNFVFYNDTTFSVEIKLTEHMTLTKTGETKDIPLHDRLYFTYYEGAYRLVSKKSITE